MIARISRSFAVGSALVAVATTASAQQRLLDLRALSTGAVFEQWTFGLPASSGGSASVTGASQITIPITAVVPITSTWAIDAYAAYARGTVTIDRGGSIGSEQLSLTGVSDAKIRLVGKLSGDNVLITLGASLPSGTTGLDPKQIEALSVLAAPALRFRTPTLGSGPGGTGGLVFAGQAGEWSLAFAGSFEYRGNFSPSQALAAGVDKPTLRAGNAMHVSFAADRLVGQARQTLSVIGDYFTDGELKDPAAGGSAGQLAFKLGPAVTATYQVQGTTGNLESMFYLLDRVRSNYSIADSAVAGSWRNEAELGFVNAFTVNPSTSIRFGVDSRFHTAPATSEPDPTLVGFSTAGILAGGATLGVRFATSSGSLMLEPFVRAQAGQLDFGGPARRATGVAAGLTFTGRF